MTDLQGKITGFWSAVADHRTAAHRPARQPSYALLGFAT